MIQKNIFFIWFGNYIPLYIKNNIQHCIKLNPTYNVIFIYRTLQEIYNIKHGKITNIYDKLIFDSYLYLISEHKYYSYIQELKKNVLVYNVESLTSLSDILRLELLNTFGGIYIDCDVFLIKPFDDMLLMTEQFVVKVHHNDNYFSSDNFFIGSSVNTKKLIMPFLNPRGCKLITQTVPKWYLNVQYIKNKKYFYDSCFNNIKSAFNNDFYIEHYTRRYN